MKKERAPRQAVSPEVLISQSNALKPSLCRVAVSAFLDHDSDCKVPHMKCNTHEPHLLSEDVAKPPTV